ncbi:MAG: glycosyl transferase family 28, partial [Actinomyces sp.]
VPRETPRLEQLIRATALKKAGAVDLLRASALSATALEDRLTELLGDQEIAGHQLMGRRRLRLDGLATVPLLAAELIGDRGDTPTTRLTRLTSYATGLTRMEISA